MRRNDIQHTIDTHLSSIAFTGQNQQAVFAAIKGEKPMKRKMSFALVLALIIALLTGVALAIATWHHHAEEIARMEAEQGYYFEWEADSRVALVRHLVEGGVLPPDERTARLFSGSLSKEEASALATQIMTEWSEIREDAISLMSILEAVWGRYPYDWSDEDLVWYTDTLEKNGEKLTSRFYLPQGGVLSKEQAIGLAMEYVKPLVNYPQAVWDTYTATAIYESQPYAGTDEPYWTVRFHPSPRWTERTYIPSVIIDPRTGGIYSDEVNLTPEDALKDYHETIAFWGSMPIGYARFLPHEERAALLSEELGGYSVPDPTYISEEKATAIADTFFQKERGYTDAQMAKLTGYAFYRAGFGGGRPVWIVKYYDESVRLPDNYMILSVDLYADTGEITSSFPRE